MDKALTDCIGRQATYTAPDPLGASAIRYFARATQDDNPIYRNQSSAKQTRHRGIIAPPTLICETNQFSDGNPHEHEYGGHHWDLPLEGRRVIRGGNDYEFFRPVRPDDVITVKWEIVDISEKVTKNSGSMIFVVSRASYYDQNGELLAINNETMMYAL